MSRFFGSAIHVAYVVPDLEPEIRRLLASGIGPIFRVDHVRPQALYRGQRHDPLISALLLYSGEMQLEYVQQHDDTPSAYKEFIDRNPAGGLHHLAYFCSDFSKTLADAARAGQNFTIVQEFLMPEGRPFEIYVEPQASGSYPLLAQLTRPGPISSTFDEMKEICANWDGREPIRDALSLLPREMQSPQEFS